MAVVKVLFMADGTNNDIALGGASNGDFVTVLIGFMVFAFA